MTNTRAFRVALLLSLTGVVACSDDPVDEPDVTVIAPDASDTSVGQDTSHDTAEDVVEDTAVDAQSDTVQDTAEDVVPDLPPPRCDVDDDCNDGRSCTTDTCDTDAGVCVWEVADDACLIGGACVDEETRSPSNGCELCDPATSQTEWSIAENGTACSGDACTVAATCTDGVCVGDALTCEDGNPCTENTCDPELGCVFPDAETGTVCDDGSLCTTDDVCDAGSCAGIPLDCDDGDACTDTACDEDTGECTSTFNTAPCDDGDACTAGDVCSEGVCAPTGVTNCVDGDECTIDICDPEVGCAYLPTLNPCCTDEGNVCDDGNPCTTDICNPETNDCSYEPNTAVCDDGNACTDGDVCGAEACGGSPLDCDTDNECLAPSCDEDDGCMTTPLSDIPCDDGVACTVADTCQAGVCVGTSECVCEPTFGLQAVKVTALRIGSGGVAGEGLDLDDDVTTCAPSGCELGLHNALSIIAGFANDPLAEAVVEGDVMLVMDVDNIDLNPFEISVFQADLDPANAECDFQTETCDYIVDRSMLDADTCQPIVRLPATRVGTTVTAGGRGTIFPFELPLGDSTLLITLYDVRFEGTIEIVDGEIVSLDGILGGAVPKEELLNALDSVDPESLPVEPAVIANLLDRVVTNDIDTDGDGEPDAASIGIPLSAIGANVTGAE